MPTHRSGTLGEFAIAYEEGKLIGVLSGTGGITDALRHMETALRKETGAEVIYDPDPARLVDRLLGRYQAPIPGRATSVGSRPAQAQHGRARGPVPTASQCGGSRGGDRPVPAPRRPGRGAGRRLPLRRAGRPGRDRPLECHERDRGGASVAAASPLPGRCRGPRWRPGGASRATCRRGSRRSTIALAATVRPARDATRPSWSRHRAYRSRATEHDGAGA
jgi:hypothetical protein